MAQPEPVRLVPGGAVDRPAEQALLAAAAACDGDVDAMVELLRAASGAASDDDAAPLDLPLTGAGRTREQWELLASVAAQDLSAARVLEPHLDALTPRPCTGRSRPPSPWCSPPACRTAPPRCSPRSRGSGTR